MDNPKTFQTTSTLKGIAISGVLVNHYLNLFVSGVSNGYANIGISIFFMLSGYGIFHSLDKYYIANPNKIFSNQLLLFYAHRIVRIFPLLWLAWLIEIFLRKGNLSFWIPSGVHAEHHYWFIPALLHCYFLAPFIYWGIKKNSMVFVIALLCGFALINSIIFYEVTPMMIKKIGRFAFPRWRGIYTLYILVFSAGCLIPYFADGKREERNAGKRFRNILFWCFTFSIVSLVIISRRYGQNDFPIKIVFDLLHFVFIAMLCVFSLVFSVRNKFFALLGRRSYSLFLFHMSFFLLLGKMGGFQPNAFEVFIWFLAGFPVFLFICNYLEKGGNYLNRKFKGFSGMNRSGIESYLI